MIHDPSPAGYWRTLLLVGCCTGIVGCGLLFQEGGQGWSNEDRVQASHLQDDTAGLPAGLGTLRQNEISIYLRRGDLQLRVTPLRESVIRVTAPDTYERLSALADGHHRIFRDRTGSAVAFELFLVAVHAEATRVRFEPEDLNLVSRGLRYRPADIHPVTPAWERRQVGPQETLMAVYAFPPEVDLEESLEVEYQELRDRSWERIHPRIQAERFRIRSGG